MDSQVAAPEREAKVELGLTGMTCAACATRIEKVLNRVPGAHATVNFATGDCHRRLRLRRDVRRCADRGGRARGLWRHGAPRSRGRPHARPGAQGRGVRAGEARVRDRGGADRSAVAADGADARRRRALRRRARGPAAALAAARARHARAVLDRPPVLRRRVERAARRRREHGRAGRAGHDDGLRVQRRGHRVRAARPARLLRGGRGRHHAGAARQAARGAREGRHVRGARRPAAAAAEDRARRCATASPSTCRCPTWSPAIASSFAPARAFRSTASFATARRRSTRAC